MRPVVNGVKLGKDAVAASGRGKNLNGSKRLNGHAGEPELNGKTRHVAALNGTKVNGTKVHGKGLNGHAHPAINGQGSTAVVERPNGKSPHATPASRVAYNRIQGGNGSRKTVSFRLSAKALVAQDRLLVDHCLSGDATAWSQLYDRFHASLLASIRAFLGRAGQDAHLVDEISARVWYALVRNEFELLAKFDPARGCRLSTFLSVLGKSEARLLLRSERRRKTRECVASRPEIEHPDGLGAGLADDEFLATLSPRERAFYLDILVSTGDPSGDLAYSRQNQWQLRHRVRKKLEQFLE